MALQSRLDRYPRDRVGALAEWNINYLDDALCSGVRRGSLGIDSRSIAAIVQQEVLPVEPDLIVYYEGANEFAPASLLAACQPQGIAGRGYAR